MDFSQIEKPLSEWATENNLHIFTMYKDEEVRTVDIMDDSNSRWQLWLEPNPKENKCAIHYWNFKDHQYKVESPVSELKKNLQMIYDRIMKNGIR